ncbi:MAG: response regulator [Candidatus Omnitrophica bacterium]|nr:response regulator [Candidatus Omnitrophota bacterium]
MMLSEEILVIDDDDRVIKSLKVALLEYRITAFIRGREALTYLRKPNLIHLVLLDVMMPDMDGLSVLREIKAINRDIGVIMMTGYGSKDVIIEALRLHADDFVEKPFEIEDIKAKIRTVLQEKVSDPRHQDDVNGHLRRIKSFVRRDPKNASLELIAEQMQLSPRYISRMFIKHNGESFREYKMKIKMEKARELLTRSRLSINEIAINLGYQNGESFMRLFKRENAMTPTQYRSNYGGGKRGQ